MDSQRLERPDPHDKPRYWKLLVLATMLMPPRSIEGFLIRLVVLVIVAAVVFVATLFQSFVARFVALVVWMFNVIQAALWPDKEDTDHV